LTIIAVTNQKGGVGKTTTCINLAASLAVNGQRVLLVDLDPQGNASTGSGLDKHALERSVYDVLVHGTPVHEAIRRAANDAYDVLPANGDLTAAEVELLHLEDRDQRLRRPLSELSPAYDYILIDCPPSLNMLTVNALVAAGLVLIPVQCEYYALEGLTALMDTITRIQQVNRDLRIEGLVRTMHDSRITLANEVSLQLISHFGSRVYSTVIPRNVRLAEAPSHGCPVLDYDRGSRGALAYLTLAAEMLRRHGHEVPEPVVAEGTHGG
jgi:chromosome partitioning protein